MGKSNNIQNKFNKIYKRDKNLNNTFTENEIQILEKINSSFIDNFVIEFSRFLKNNVKLIFQFVNIKLFNFNISSIKRIQSCHVIETLPYNNKSFIVFSYDFLSSVIDLLFGGSGNFKDEINNIKDIKSNYFFINEKIVELIIKIYSNCFKNYFSSDISFINVKIVINFKKYDFNQNNFFLINCFNFNMNNVEVFFGILIPISILKTIKNQHKILINNDEPEVKIKNKSEHKIFLHDIRNVTLNIISRIINISLFYDKFNFFSVGDILLIEKPDKIVGFIENKPIFIGHYKRFNEQNLVFIEEFVNNNLESNLNIGYTLMSHNNKEDSKKQVIEANNDILPKDFNNNLSFEKSHKNILNNSDKSINNQDILLNTHVNISVELGRTKIKIKDFLNFSKGSMLILDKLKEKPLDIFINDHLIASGEMVVLEKKYGVRITKIYSSLETINV